MKYKTRNKWYVITGAPCSGKTTIIRELEKLGHSVLYEQARVFIEMELKKGKLLTEIRNNELEFQRKILEFKSKIEKRLPKRKLFFFDRGVPDSIAYFKLCGVDTDPVLEKHIANCSYKKVFFFEPLDFKKDHARTENLEEVKKLSKLLKESYISLNMEVITVPIMSIQERLQFVLQNI